MKRALVILTVGAFVAVCIGLGIWQLDRLGDKRAFNERLTSRGALPIEDVGTIVPSGVAADVVVYRRARATGAYDTAREVILLSRSHRGLSGHHVLTPLVTADGRALLVDRGWVPLIHDEPPVADATPPSGTLTATGVLLPSVERGRFGPRTTTDGPHTQVFRVDLDVLSGQFPYELYPVWVQLQEQTPPTVGEYPIPVGAPPLDEGPHLAYATQWFLFAAAAVVTAVAVARKRQRAPVA